MSKLSLSFKGNLLKVFPLTQGEMLIGSDPSCLIHIDSLAVQPRHARILTEGSRSVLYDLGNEDGTFVNNQRIEQHELADGEVIRVGKHTLTFIFEEPVEAEAAAPTAPEPPAAPPADGGGAPDNRQGWLQILSGHNMGKTISLHRAMTNLGKPGAVNAVIVRRNEGYFLSHLEGSLTPSVGGKPIGDQSWKLKEGDVIQIGNVQMQFYLQ